MKSCFHIFLCMFALLTIAACADVNPQIAVPSPMPSGAEASEIHSVFEGITPCSAVARPLPQIPADTNCEQMIWKLVLNQDPETGAPTTYRLESAYGLPKQNTNDLVGGGTLIVMEGKWEITTGTKIDPEAIVYQLYSDDPQTTVSILKISDNLLHVLSREKTLLVGNAGWSYTLNRTDNQPPASEVAGTPLNPPTRPPLPPIPAGSSVFGVFEGRTPCHEIVFEFTKIASFPDCMKIKWRLTLYQNEATGAPSTYLYQGTTTLREGSWTISGGMDGDPDAVVYQLQLDNAQQPVSFLKVDENHLYLMDRAMDLLVGNELFSYTLNRIEPGAQ